MKNNLILQLLKWDLFKMSNVQRYSWTQVIVPENLAQHSYYVTVLADLISEDISERFPDIKIDKNKILSFALYHDYEEIYTWDIITPVKYKNKEFREKLDSLWNLLLTEWINSNFEWKKHIWNRIKESHKNYELWRNDLIESKIVKFADMIQALWYVIQEVNMWNSYMNSVLKNIIKLIKEKYWTIDEFKIYIENLSDAVLDDALLK